jgi:alanine racemase
MSLPRPGALPEALSEALTTTISAAWLLLNITTKIQQGRRPLPVLRLDWGLHRLGSS